MANLNLNKVILGGRLTVDPELKMTQSGIAVTSFTVAVDRRYKAASGETETDYVNCEAWRQTAEFICKYFTKGSSICVEGAIKTGSYEKDGVKHYTTKVSVDQAYFVDSKSDGGRKSDLPPVFTPADLDRAAAAHKAVQPPKDFAPVDGEDLPF